MLPGGPAIMIPFGFEAGGRAAAAYLITTVVLRAQRRLPLRLMRFLDDAHRFGLLSAVGPACRSVTPNCKNRLAEIDPIIR
jgi:hypothetical protein